MCTVTWIQDGERLRLFCNRDELRTRAPSLPPRLDQHDGVAYAAPVDGEAGGTWIAVNQHGVALCLLNDYRSPVPGRPEGFRSRGQLVKMLVSAAGREPLLRGWRSIDLEPYRPFSLLALLPGESPQLLRWNGTESAIQSRRVAPPLSSSSFDDDGAASARREALRNFQADTRQPPDKRLLAFHRSHLPERGPYSVCMHRPDAVTVSFSLVEVDPGSVSLAYAPGPPCSTQIDTLVTLPKIDARA